MHCHRIHLEIRGIGSGKWHLVRPVPMQVLYLLTAGADHMGVRGNIAVVPGNFMEGIDLHDQPKLAEGFQRLIHRIKGDHRQIPPHLLINVISAGMIVTRYNILKDLQPLGSYGNMLLFKAFGQLIE